jgi:hypothetical protein
MYVLMESRKIMDHEPDLSHKFPTLNFYCNWVAHIDLDRNRAARDFIQSVMPILTLDGGHTSEQQQGFDRLLTLRAFRDELSGFLTEHGIADHICTDDANWLEFVNAYSRVVDGVPIKLTTVPSPSGPLGLSVVSLTVSAAAGTFADNRPYPMDWLVEYEDGRKAQLTLSQYGLLGATLAFF